MSASPPDSYDDRPEGLNPSTTSSTSRVTTRSAKKRTKTGCLTCRKRRIKCGEEKPVCNNCIKSKRLCEGYNQRVVFKHPIGGFHRPGISSDPSHGANTISPYYEHGLFSGSAATHLPIAPRPFQPSAPLENPVSQLNSGGPQYDASGHIVATTCQPPISGAEPAWAPAIQARRISHHEGSQDQLGRSLGFPQIPTSASNTGRRLSAEQAQLRNALPASWEHHSPGQNVSPEAWYLANLSRQSTDNSQNFPFHRSDYLDVQAQIQALQKENQTLPADRNTQKFSRFGFSQRPSFDLTLPLQTEPAPPPGSAMQDEDEDEEDPFDVEMDVSQSPVTSLAQAEKDYGLLMAVHASQDRRRFRTFTTFLNEPNVLASYRPSHSASPLTDEKTARLFCHFVSATGPSLSIFERQATNPSAGFSDLPIPAAQQALWAYTLPTIALNHPPLMHAILALAAIHISKLQQTSAGPSIKHFQYALRRVSKLIGLPKRRNEVSTLATSLAVTFYEIMSADHSKWSIHLAGAKILVMEIDFAGTTRMIRAMRAQAKARISHAKEVGYGDPYAAAGVPDALLVDKDWEVDQSLISGLMGFRVRYDQQWQSNGPSYYPREELTQKDIENYKIRSDLYWWYCKQDIFQSMISGNRLLMPYEHWVYCPPRGQISRLDTIYATMDHLCLLMARLTDFGAKDQRRKRRYISAHGGQWRPPPGLFGPPSNGPPPQGPGPPGLSQTKKDASPEKNSGRTMPPAFVTSSRHESSGISAGSQAPGTNPTGVAGGGVKGGHLPSQATAPSAGPGEPPMYGMMPTSSKPIEMSSAFNIMEANLNDPALRNYPAEAYANVSAEAYNEGCPLPGASTYVPDPLNDHETELEAALAEHAAIASAFDLFTSSLTTEFHALAADAAPPINTPFGHALQYRTHHIACIWTLYNAGRILLHRLHPHMPPAAMIAASVAARQSAPYAQNIGKICAGLYYPQRDSLRTGQLNPSLGAALMESTFPLFFGAVQFMDPAQRGWTISKLRDIARLTGWQTSAAIAAGCEITWERLGMAGKGPPYRPTMDRENRDERVSMKKREKRSKKRKVAMEGRDGEAGKNRDTGREREEIVSREYDDHDNREEDENEDDEDTNRPGISEEDEAPEMINHDRRFISSHANARVHWALGILSVEEDIAKLDLERS